MQRIELRLRQLGEQFWFVPALLTLLALVLAEVGISAEERYGVPASLTFIYGGGEAGARSLLGAVAGSAIGVAGTVFSITIAALSYAAGSMGPRLLDHFTRDRGNQIVLGTFIATFAFSLYTLRAVQGGSDFPFVPHYNVTGALALALACVAALVYYVAHITGSINVTRVVNLLRDDLEEALERATKGETLENETCSAPPPEFWEGGEVLRASGSGYLQLLDIQGLIDRAEQGGAALRLDVRPGDYVFRNSVIGRGVPHLPPDVLGALTLGPSRTRGQDLEYSVRQLTEVAARALSPGVNDPFTATDVIDRFGDALCGLQGRGWPSGVHLRDGHLRLVHPTTTYGGLLDSMFHLIRQYGKGSPAVTLRLLQVLGTVADCTDDEDRRTELRRHTELVYADALENTPNPSDQAELTARARSTLAALRPRAGE